MPYTNETHIAVTCRECGYRWQMTYSDLQHYRVVYRGTAPTSADAPSASDCAGEEYHVTCRNPQHGEEIGFCLPVKE